MELSNYKKEGTPCPSGMRSVCHARRARPARPPPQRPGSAPGSPGPPQRPGKGGGQSSGATVRKQHPTGGDRAGRWARRNDGRPCIAWQESLPAGWFVFCLADFFSSSSFGVVLFLKLRGLQSRRASTPASCSGPDNRARGEPAVPAALRRSAQDYRSTSAAPAARLQRGSAESSGTAACPRFPEQTSPGSSPGPPCARWLPALVPLQRTRTALASPALTRAEGICPGSEGSRPFRPRGVPRVQLPRPARWSRGLGKAGKAPMDVARFAKPRCY